MSRPAALVIGASRGIGRQIAIDLAQAGYAVVVAAKSTSESPPHSSSSSPPDPNSPLSTITTVALEITRAGHPAHPVPVDVRDPRSIDALVATALRLLGRIDVLVYNPGAVWWSSVARTPLSRFRLMQRVNPEGLYAAVHAALPHMRAQPSGGRIVVVSPPIYSRFFRGKTAYAMGKVAMSVLTKGLAMDFEREGLQNMAITSLWPAVAIESAATQKFTAANPEELRDLRKPSIFSRAVVEVVRANPAIVNGQLLLDEDFLHEHAGVTDFSQYSVVPGALPRRIMPLRLPDLTVDEQDDEGRRYDSAKCKL
ncbi:Hydroxysteroid dehydrogenase-like protein 2 [Escovopsis weberi]|uniref:Hydroxysteroid dehydrogenase-like protein 2 n=1 Tax=Escovopsis weberi TaxID=150374 RepID=A0A0M8MRN9_ESCWE|nr:Hydroxysteroid dehydrogenase-like protein 2 [Escovopsis weberi]